MMRQALDRVHEVAAIHVRRPKVPSGARAQPRSVRLDEILRRHGPLDTWEVISFVTSVAAALDEAHARGITHGHVRPRNILIDERGVARLLFPDVDRPEDEGDVRYLPPERVMGAGRTRPADLYGLGLVAYDMIAGQPAYPDSHDSSRTRARILAGAPRLSDEVPGVAPVVSEVVARATARDTRERYPSAGEFARELGKAIRASDKTEVLTRPLLEAARGSSRPTTARVAAALPAALLLLGVFMAVGGFAETRTVRVAPPAGAIPGTVLANPAFPAIRPATAASGMVARSATPDVLGMKWSDAAKLLRSRGFRNDVEITVDRNAAGRAGTVIRQEPAAGASFQPGQRAKLVVVGPIDD